MSQSDTCRWCGAPAKHTREVEPEKIDPKTQKVIKQGIYAPVCEQHSKMFDRENRRADLRKVIGRLEGLRRRKRPFSPETLAEARLELEELSR